MAFDLAQTRLKSQQALHGCLAVSCTYQHDAISPLSTIVARWGNKTKLYGDLESDGYAQSIEAADQIIVAQSVSAALGMRRGGVIHFAAYNMTFQLDTREPVRNPYSETWLVRRI